MISNHNIPSRLILKCPFSFEDNMTQSTYIDFLESYLPTNEDGTIDFGELSAEEIASMRAEWLRKKAVENCDNGVDHSIPDESQ